MQGPAGPKISVIACCPGCLGMDAASWVGFAPPAFLLAPSQLQPVFTLEAKFHWLYLLGFALPSCCHHPDRWHLYIHLHTAKRVATASPPPCVPLPAALPRSQGSSKAPRKVSVIKAAETVLECETVGMPLPTVTWVKDGQPVAGGEGLLLTEQGRRLRITKAELAHAGRYTCLVANAVGQERREFDVAVHGRSAGQGWWLGVWTQAGGRGWQCCTAQVQRTR